MLSCSLSCRGHQLLRGVWLILLCSKWFRTVQKANLMASSRDLSVMINIYTEESTGRMGWWVEEYVQDTGEYRGRLHLDPLSTFPGTVSSLAAFPYAHKLEHSSVASVDVGVRRGQRIWSCSFWFKGSRGDKTKQRDEILTVVRDMRHGSK